MAASDSAGFTKDIVVIGASAGGMDALSRLVSRLPAGLPASVFVVWHLSPGLKSILPQVLMKHTPLPALHPEDGDPIVPGRIYVAPNDRHLLIEKGYVRVTKGPKENRFRPAVDPLFRSAAYLYGPRVIGVVLTGALDDGTAGLWTIKLRGGTAIVQEPQEALIRAMPLNALENVDVDHKLPVEQIGELLVRLVREPAGPAPEIDEAEDEKTRRELGSAGERSALDRNVMAFGELSPLTCPDCHGTFTALREGRLVRFRCHTGHAYSPAALLEATAEQTEARLWEAVRAFDETVMLLNQMGEQLLKAGDEAGAGRLFDQAREAHERSMHVRAAAMGDAPQARNGEGATLLSEARDRKIRARR